MLRHRGGHGALRQCSVALLAARLQLHPFHQPQKVVGSCHCSADTSRTWGIAVREKVIARPSAARSTFTTFGS